MKVIRFVQFDDGEMEVYRRALWGLGGVLVDEPRHKRDGDAYYPAEVWRNRLVEHHEPLNNDALVELGTVLRRMVAELDPQTKVEWWRAYGAPGADDAVEGLAATRRQQVDRLTEAMTLTVTALAATLSNTLP